MDINERNSLYASKLCEMIRHKTISAYNETNVERFREFHDVLRSLFPKLFEVCEFNDYDGSVLMIWRGKKHDKPVMFMNHHDVVEADGDWKYPPFDGVIAEDKVWGRGALDTKGGLMCMLQAGEELAEAGFVPEQDIYFESACTEECEGSGAEKISRLLAEKGIHFSYILDEGGMIVYDPVGGADGYFAMIGLGEKGCADIIFRAHSNGGHASTPGKNTPLVRLAKFVAAAEKANIYDVKLSPVVCEMFRRLSVKMNGPLKVVLGNPEKFAPVLKKVLPSFSATAGAMLKTTLAFTMASGSEAINVLPQDAWIAGNMRFSHHQGGKNSFEVTRKLAAKYDVEMEVTDPGFESMISDFNSAEFKKIESAVRELFPDVLTSPYVTNTASDCRFMSRVSDNCFRFTPFTISDEQLDSIHGLNENVDVKCLAPAVDFYKYLMKN